MRNLLAYPISLDEVVSELKRVETEFEALETIGGMRGLLVEKAREFIEQNAELFEAFLKQNPL